MNRALASIGIAAVWNEHSFDQAVDPTLNEGRNTQDQREQAR